jgi:mRNA interferase MazF
MKLNRGDIVLLDYPYGTGTGSKVRPALIVQSDIRNRILDHTIVALVSSSTGHAAHDPTQLLIEIATAEGTHSGLRRDSVVKCGNLFTIHESLLRRRIGTLSVAVMQRIDTCLKAALEIA